MFDAPKPIDWTPPAGAVGKVVLIGRNLTEADMREAETKLADQSEP